MLTTSFTLLQRLRDVQEQATWSRFVDLYTPLFYSWAQRLGLGREDAADAVQDFFLLLFQKLPSFSYNTHGCFRPWLRTVFRNWSRDWLDRLHRQGRATAVDAQDLAAVAGPDLGDPLEETEFQTYVINRTLELIRGEFQEVTWRAFHEHMVLGRPPADVARDLGITPNAVYLAKLRVLHRVREEVGDMLG